jgi:tetratricopeptide (TPR) repeat protein
MRLRRTLGVAAAISVVGAGGLDGQLAAPKRGVDANGGVRCPTLPRASTPGQNERARARELTTLGQQAAITGDNRAARDLFRQAAEIDPSDPGIAYYLARSFESLGEAPQAMREYCRALSLAPSGPDAADTRERLGRLTLVTRTLPEASAALFTTGIAHYEKRRYREAAAAFDSVIRSAPEWEPAYYNRALTNTALDRADRAVRDYERYLELAPDAPDRMAVAREILRLRRSALSPATALVAGVVPGVGQFYTRRPLFGVLVAAGVGGAAYLAFREKDETRTETFVDPFGNVREFEVTERVRPNYTVGLVAAAGITLASALEAYFYARRSRAALAPRPTTTRQAEGAALSPVLSPVLSPSLDGSVRMGVRLSFGGE